MEPSRPVDRLNAWIANNHAFFKEQSALYAHNFNGDTDVCDQEIREEIRKLRNWTIAHGDDPKVIRRRSWKRAWGFWWKRALSQRGHILGHLTYAQEQEYYARKRRRSGVGDEPKRISETLREAGETCGD